MQNWNVFKMRKNLSVMLTPLKPTKNLSNFYNMATWDTETKDGLNGIQLYCWSFCLKQNDELIVHSGTNIEEFIEYLDNLSLGKRKLVIFVHNLDFDIRFIDDYLLSHNRTLTKRIESGSMVLQAEFYQKSKCNALEEADESEHYNIKRKNRIYFRESMQFLQTSQDKAEKEWNIDENLRKIDCQDLFECKFELWNNMDKQRLKAHNQNDVKALLTIMEKLRLEIFGLFGMDFLKSISIASLSMKCFRTTLLEAIYNPNFIAIKRKGFKKIDYKMKAHYEYVRKCYVGGRVEVFKHSSKAMNQKKIAYNDVNSEYPYANIVGTYPKGYPTMYSKFKSVDEFIPLLSSEGFAQIEVECPYNLHIPLLYVKKDDKLYFPKGIFTGYYAFPEIRKALTIGYKIIRVIDCLVYPLTQNPFKPYVTKLYLEKSISTGGRRQTCKIFLNGLGGKFGQNMKQSKTVSKMISAEQALTEYTNVNLRKASVSNHYFVFENKESISIKPYLIPEFSAYMTSISRVYLYEFFEKVGLLNMIYCDTDSLIFEYINENPLKNFIGNEIGQIKDEITEINAIYAICPKTYIIQHHLNEFEFKAKGVTKSMKKQILHNAMSIEEILQNINCETLFETRYMKTRESLRRVGGFLSVKNLTRRLSLSDKKRNWIDENYSEPWEFPIYNYQTKLEPKPFKVRFTGKIAHTERAKERMRARLSNYAEFVLDIDTQTIDIDTYIDYKLTDDENAERMKALIFDSSI